MHVIVMGSSDQQGTTLRASWRYGEISCVRRYSTRCARLHPPRRRPWGFEIALFDKRRIFRGQQGYGGRRIEKTPRQGNSRLDRSDYQYNRWIISVIDISFAGTLKSNQFGLSMFDETGTYILSYDWKIILVSLSPWQLDEEIAGSEPNTVSLRREIAVLDENDNPPVYHGRPYAARVPESTPVGGSLLPNGTITITDRDGGVNADVQIKCIPATQDDDSCEVFHVTIDKVRPRSLSCTLINFQIHVCSWTKVNTMCK